MFGWVDLVGAAHWLYVSIFLVYVYFLLLLLIIVIIIIVILLSLFLLLFLLSFLLLLLLLLSSSLLLFFLLFFIVIVGAIVIFVVVVLFLLGAGGGCVFWVSSASFHWILHTAIIMPIHIMTFFSSELTIHMQNEYVFPDVESRLSMIRRN